MCQKVHVLDQFWQAIDLCFITPLHCNFQFNIYYLGRQKRFKLTITFKNHFLHGSKTNSFSKDEIHPILLPDWKISAFDIMSSSMAKSARPKCNRGLKCSIKIPHRFIFYLQTRHLSWYCQVYFWHCQFTNLITVPFKHIFISGNCSVGEQIWRNIYYIVHEIAN